MSTASWVDARFYSRYCRLSNVIYPIPVLWQQNSVDNHPLVTPRFALSINRFGKFCCEKREGHVRSCFFWESQFQKLNQFTNIFERLALRNGELSERYTVVSRFPLQKDCVKYCSERAGSMQSDIVPLTNPFCYIYFVGHPCRPR